jgi:simple sugar transport system permease protein/ribose transport system permease protein
MPQTDLNKQAKAPILHRIFQIREMGVLLALTVIFVAFSIASEDFLTPNNMINIAKRISQYAIMACGMTMVIIAAEIDLSVGTFFGMSVALLARVVKAGLNVWAGAVVVLIVGALVGLFIGLVVTKVRVPSFIVSLGLLNIFKTLTLVLTGAWVISGFDDSLLFFDVFSGDIGIFPTEIIWMAVVAILSYVILNKSVYGYNLFATGGNKEAAGLSGVDTDRVKIIAFMISSTFVAFTGVVGFAHIASASPEAGAGRELDVIAGVIVGGTNLFGGVGTIIGTLLGVAIIGVIRNGLIMVGIRTYWHAFFIGLIIIIAVTINQLMAHRRSAR